MKYLIELDEEYVKAIDKIRFLVGGRTDRKLQLEIIKAIKNGKALEQEPKTGHWIKIGDRGFGFSDTVICKCSECEYQTEFMGKFDGHNLIVDTERAYNYCPNCGADMREVEE